MGVDFSRQQAQQHHRDLHVLSCFDVQPKTFLPFLLGFLLVDCLAMNWIFDETFASLYLLRPMLCSSAQSARSPRRFLHPSPRNVDLQHSGTS